mmetsp:Transcript_74651/g.213870  ORF Transcript_74651/g.213870 Transcript_74651/m.213870 type:complete len:94 (-) Transcript_74651:7-288(-)
MLTLCKPGPTLEFDSIRVPHCSPLLPRHFTIAVGPSGWQTSGEYACVHRAFEQSARDVATSVQRTAIASLENAMLHEVLNCAGAIGAEHLENS